jgi:hypothetical protein
VFSLQTRASMSWVVWTIIAVGVEFNHQFCQWRGRKMNLDILIGKVLSKVTNTDDVELVFTTMDGKQYKLFHYQDCCEHVYIESIVGELDDLVGEPILRAEEVVSRNEHPEGYVSENDWEDESFTWTFYKFATRKGYVDVRWYGSSNGYYSESVSFEEC